MPPEHLHPKQEERFAVIEGSMRAIVGEDGDELQLTEGAG
jgi:uncharacterized cupin superfamily protein